MWTRQWLHLRKIPIIVMLKILFGKWNGGLALNNLNKKEDPVREKRIEQEITVDGYDASERAMGWYYYLQDKLGFPFRACCIAERIISPLKKNEKVQVMGMAPEEDCEKEMFVEVVWQGKDFAVSLTQLKGVEADGETQEVIGDWHYWIARGYEF